MDQIRSEVFEDRKLSELLEIYQELLQKVNRIEKKMDTGLNSTIYSILISIGFGLVITGTTIVVSIPNLLSKIEKIEFGVVSIVLGYLFLAAPSLIDYFMSINSRH